MVERLLLAGAGSQDAQNADHDVEGFRSKDKQRERTIEPLQGLYRGHHFVGSFGRFKRKCLLQ